MIDLSKKSLTDAPTDRRHCDGGLTATECFR